MFNGSNHFGKAYQEELLHTAGFQDGQEIDAHRKSQSQEQGLLIKFLSGLFGKTEGDLPFRPEPIRKPDSLFGR
jgi:hypothetical protein